MTRMLVEGRRELNGSVEFRCDVLGEGRDGKLELFAELQCQVAATSHGCQDWSALRQLTTTLTSMIWIKNRKYSELFILKFCVFFGLCKNKCKGI